MTLVRFAAQDTYGRRKIRYILHVGRAAKSGRSGRLSCQKTAGEGGRSFRGTRLAGWVRWVVSRWSKVGGGLLLARAEGPSRVSQRGSKRRCSAIVSGGAARSRLELSHAPTSTSIHLPASSASDRFLVWTIRPGCLPPPLPALNPINNAVGSRLRVTAALPRTILAVVLRVFMPFLKRADSRRVFACHARLLTGSPEWYFE